MRFKNEGSTLIETMLAVTMMAMILAPLFLLENTVFDGVTRITEQFRRYLFAHNFLYEAQRKQPDDAREFSLEHKEIMPETSLRYTLKKVSDGVFKKQTNLYRQEVVITSKDKHVAKDTLVTYIFKPIKIQDEK